MEPWEVEADALLDQASAHHNAGRSDRTLVGPVPEDADGTDTSDGLAADVFRLGCALYELATGEGPFGLPPDPERLRVGAAVPPRALDPLLPARVEHALMAALAARPEERPADAAALAALWRGEAQRTTSDLAGFARRVAARAHPGARFPSTRWSMVLYAGVGHTEALAALCTAYWWPLYAFARRQGCDPEQAEDAVQGFFAEVLGRNDLQGLRERQGRFRAWMRLAMKRWLLKGWRAERTQKRGGGQAVVPLDLRDAEGRLQVEPSGGASPDAVFDRLWARQVWHRARVRVGEQYRSRGQAVRFDALQDCLGEGLEAPYAELAAGLGMSVGALKVAVHRLKRHFGVALRAEIAETVDDPSAIEAEIRDLQLELAADR